MNKIKKMKTAIFILLFLALNFSICGFALAADRVEINTASLKQLDEITGIGPVIGQRIIDARPFSSIDDLLRVKGIGEKTLQKIKDQGLAYVEPVENNSKTIIEDKKEPEKQNTIEKTKADISENIDIDNFAPQTNKTNIYTYLTALITAFFSGTIIFVLNKSL